jgi:lipopolysaccharide transport system ATP-binding protein
MEVSPRVTAAPAVFHVTHPKAGSQWVRRILTECWPARVVTPQEDQGHFLGQAVRPGAVYPALYVTRGQFEAARLPPLWRRFVVVRDLRDTLVSFYFSIRFSHAPEFDIVRRWRAELGRVSVEEGLLRLMGSWLHHAADIQRSWLGERLVRYEDLLARDLELLERVLLGECSLPAVPGRLREAVLGARFERLTGGRPRGQEDRSAHERKGVAGDWRNHFTGQLARQFKDRFGELLVQTGYEKDGRW